MSKRYTFQMKLTIKCVKCFFIICVADGHQCEKYFHIFFKNINYERNESIFLIVLLFVIFIILLFSSLISHTVLLMVEGSTMGLKSKEILKCVSG